MQLNKRSRVKSNQQSQIAMDVQLFQITLDTGEFGIKTVNGYICDYRGDIDANGCVNSLAQFGLIFH